MGYYTRHELNIPTIVQEAVVNEVLEYIVKEDLHCEINEFEGCSSMELNGEHCGEETIYFTQEPCKWYKSSDDMKTMSSQFKDILFELRGEGEEAGDIWKAYYLNGKEQMCKARVMFDKFDESLMD